MTTYNASAVDNATIGHRKGISLQTGRRLRDNPIAIAEGDASVPLGLLPSVLLGTLTTTSGTTQTLSGLVLTPYKFIRAVVNGVKVSSDATNRLRIDSKIISKPIGNLLAGFYGVIDLDLATGVVASSIGTPVAGDDGGANGDVTSYTNATTSISFTYAGGAAFAGGSIRIYGVK